MKSYEEMTRSVLERGDKYFRRKEKRIAAVKKGAPFMSLFGIFTLVGLGLMNVQSNDTLSPDIPQQIEIVETQTETQTITKTVTETATVTETVTEAVSTASACESTSFTSTTVPEMTSLPGTYTAPFTSAHAATSRLTASAATVPNVIVKETLASSNSENINTETAVKTEADAAVTTVQTEIISDTDLEFDYMIKSDGTIEIIEPVNDPDKYEHFEKLTIPSEIDGRKVTSIGANAFFGLDNLTEVYLPDTVTGIGGGAFFSCGSLAFISFPENVKYEYIGHAAFHNTPWLKTKSTEGSFVTVNNVLYDGFNAKGNAVIPSGITYICDTAFMGNLSLKSITLSDDTEYVGAFAFSYCTELESINFGCSVRVIGEGAFANCESLNKVILPQSVERIDPGAFSSYTPSLESIYILNPDCAIDDFAGTIDNSTVIYGYSGSTAEAYAKMHDRTFVAIDAQEQKSGTWGSNTSWTLNDTTLTISGNGAIDSISYFANVYHNKFGNAPDKFKEDYPWSEYYDIITDVIIEDGITSIPVGAFCYYPELKNVELPDSLLSIEDNSFICCNNLREITIPENTVIINDNAYAEPFGYPIWTYDTVSGISSDELEEMAAFYETERRNAKNYRLTINGYDYSSSYYYCISYNCSYNSIGTAKNPFIAPSGSAGNGITWTFSDMGTMTFSGNGVIESAGLDSAAIEAAPYVRKVAFDNGITGIGDGAFLSFDYIEEVEFPETITEIGDGAFSSSMKTMGSVIIPKSVKKIGTGSICTKNGKIYGYSDTAIETYAIENNMVFVAIDKTVSGDMNCDGVVNLNDATSILSFYADMSAGCSAVFDADGQINTFLTGIADVNNDGKIDISDATLVLEAYAKSAAGIK